MVESTERDQSRLQDDSRCPGAGREDTHQQISAKHQSSEKGGRPHLKKAKGDGRSRGDEEHRQQKMGKDGAGSKGSEPQRRLSWVEMQTIKLTGEAPVQPPNFAILRKQDSKDEAPTEGKDDQQSKEKSSAPESDTEKENEPPKTEEPKELKSILKMSGSWYLREVSGRKVNFEEGVSFIPYDEDKDYTVEIQIVQSIKVTSYRAKLQQQKEDEERKKQEEEEERRRRRKERRRRRRKLAKEGKKDEAAEEDLLTGGEESDGEEELEEEVEEEEKKEEEQVSEEDRDILEWRKRAEERRRKQGIIEPLGLREGDRLALQRKPSLSGTWNKAARLRRSIV